MTDKNYISGKESGKAPNKAPNVIKADTLPPSVIKPVRKAGNFKVDVVVAEFDAYINSESIIHLAKPAYEIKRIDKEVFLNEARFVPTKFDYHKGKVVEGIVFLQGYLRKNIEYASLTSTGKSAIGGEINDTTARVKFLTSVVIKDFVNYPIIKPSPADETTRYFDKKALGKSTKEADRRTLEILNEPVHAEIEETDVIDADINIKGKPIEGFIHEEIFDKFVDKAVIRIRVKLLQKQQIKQYQKDYDVPEDNKTDNEIDSDDE
ncbi:hypothetical protein CPAST_c29480 [Clostridium pasteurianum DSM 525 = ATCC 6013]|uniref:DUF7852 domain-containing protein n=1 Tax=Clostridium pasteurianum DSM 525 = ATCC 6013 TaxID=1262449 RepID=A0A0H3J6C9_CLOPA|nr:hypothetical protein [Clostridium pasteurianum]AJA49014.1 hypothetical protein CPAST_c29480 [Clostridium pasteurianum DSM 525 = ATCC 6013]AJA53002.1 hypothetical protein CLPA_c29480 [Clostridium pasteurianum DSM 525 = ATCC 6013]AOZ76220.1 hypothetical protein AQ983_14335 [Clostridium pasteurianum DSM 525 = ATCC 6013]AOZ80016.1 hypothetical protein AQ984_14330 [Clostridium pasteurianum]ELP60310.1 hypothetical protein F502_06722 [Clostridium pasteurianum DSM 525 = ATCC 6013]